MFARRVKIDRRVHGPEQWRSRPGNYSLAAFSPDSFRRIWRSTSIADFVLAILLRALAYRCIRNRTRINFRTISCFVITSKGGWNNADIVIVIQTVLFAEIVLDCECKRAAGHGQISMGPANKNHIHRERWTASIFLRRSCRGVTSLRGVFPLMPGGGAPSGGVATLIQIMRDILRI